ncbi:hypothetical protein OOK13_23300 [Streptomyces sp. NBC_00378]|uniref:hypothetical protein n=1 Tax=unclassified Streptomyces TaxID=2593676 RepID=UPI002259D14F|nr:MULTISPECIES: hypothetical protein [unclassified Streptomyces]MCX5111418.1 hypothetical protein [Streptomyces sp. NBC_00378]
MGIADQFKDKAQELADQAKKKAGEGRNAGQERTRTEGQERIRTEGQERMQNVSERASKTSQQGRDKARGATDELRERRER